MSYFYNPPELGLGNFVKKATSLTTSNNPYTITSYREIFFLYWLKQLLLQPLILVKHSAVEQEEGAGCCLYKRAGATALQISADALSLAHADIM